MNIQPYLFFEGRCEEALAFYRKTLGAEVSGLMRYRENPESLKDVPPGSEDKILHASFKVGDSHILASDGRCKGKAVFEGFSLTVYVADEAEAKKVFTALSAGGEVRLPLTKTFFAPSFGMLTDQFGVGWMVIVREE